MSRLTHRHSHAESLSHRGKDCSATVGCVEDLGMISSTTAHQAKELGRIDSKYPAASVPRPHRPEV